MELSDVKVINKGCLLCSFKVVFPTGLYVHATLFKKKDSSGFFVAMPSREYEKDGQKKQFSLVGFTDRDKQGRFELWIVKQLQDSHRELFEPPAPKLEKDGQWDEDNLPF